MASIQCPFAGPGELCLHARSDGRQPVVTAACQEPCAAMMAYLRLAERVRNVAFFVAPAERVLTVNVTGADAVALVDQHWSPRSHFHRPRGEMGS
ncbi:MAG: hypothetical protein KKB13_26615 [Chloroflexi bacterium]|nr:hypothetical protein [Chloroflexota bacterium]